jgi:uncharacterized Zn finger protein (UPF0148 family)
MDIYQIAGFDLGPVECPYCRSWLIYQKHTGRGFCPRCEKNWKLLDFVMEKYWVKAAEAAGLIAKGERL